MRKRNRPVNDQPLGRLSIGGYVYLLRGTDGLHKIGKAKFPNERKHHLRDSTGVRPEIVHQIRSASPLWLEEQLHYHFENKCVRGEWFRLSSEDVDRICRLTYCSRVNDLPEWCPPHPLVRKGHYLRGVTISLEMAEWLNWCVEMHGGSALATILKAFEDFISRTRHGEIEPAHQWPGMWLDDLLGRPVQ